MKLHVPFFGGRGFQCGEKKGLSRKREFCLKLKITSGGVSGLTEMLCIIWRGFEGLNQKNGEKKKDIGSIVKCEDAVVASRVKF